MPTDFSQATPHLLWVSDRPLPIDAELVFGSETSVQQLPLDDCEDFVLQAAQNPYRQSLGHCPELFVVLLDHDSGDVGFSSRAKAFWSLDESLALVGLDGHAGMANAAVGYALGFNDWWGPAVPAADLRKRFLRVKERVHRARDHRRTAVDLLIKNRALTIQDRLRSEQEAAFLKSLVRILEQRDVYTAGHSERVAALAEATATHLSLSDNQISNIKTGALLHDLGKIGVPDAILHKPAQLSTDEFDRMKKHPTVGANLLAGLHQFACVAPIVRSHHEKLNGTGYPDGLSGESISIEVRVVAVADVLDALTSDRPYRKASDIEKSIGIMMDMAPHHLDPSIIGVVKELHGFDMIAPLLQRR